MKLKHTSDVMGFPEKLISTIFKSPGNVFNLSKYIGLSPQYDKFNFASSCVSRNRDSVNFNAPSCRLGIAIRWFEERSDNTIS